jgi:hypothetical protein
MARIVYQKGVPIGRETHLVNHSLLHALPAELAIPNKKIDPLESISFSTTFLTDKVNPRWSRRLWLARSSGMTVG